MANMFLDEAKATQRAKVERIVGNTNRYRHVTDKADDIGYYANEKLDPLTLPTKESVGP